MTLVTAAVAGLGLHMGPADAATTTDVWSMTVSGGTSQTISAAPELVFSGSWSQVKGVVGQAVRFDASPSRGIAAGTNDQNPGAGDFAMGEVFTSRAIPTSHYSGNLMQKGLYGDVGQVKLQLVPTGGGTVDCRVKGTRGSTMLASSVVVDDGLWHTAICWRENGQLGLTVDGVVRTSVFDPGTIANDSAIRVGNKTSLSEASDQHFGAVDCAVYVLGAGARATAASRMPC